MATKNLPLSLSFPLILGALSMRDDESHFTFFFWGGVGRWGYPRKSFLLSGPTRLKVATHLRLM